MMTRLTGAIVRAILVVVMVATPSLLLPGTSSDTAQIVVLLAFVAAGFTLMEYAGKSPSLVEFRDAPPFNRIRFGALFLTVLILTLYLRGQFSPTTMTRLAETAGAAIANTIDFPYSPVRLLVLMLPPDAPADVISNVRMAAGISYLISILSLALFIVMLRVAGWPARNGTFNFWVNLPTFDPTAGGDVVTRLERDAQVNLILGFLLPFMIPAVVLLASDIVDPISLANHHTLIWTVTAWAFLPASLLMRGIALSHVADMISKQRDLATTTDGARSATA